MFIPFVARLDNVISDPCQFDPCTGANNFCTDNGDYTRTCSCNSGHIPTTGSNPDTGCDRKHLMHAN